MADTVIFGLTATTTAADADVLPVVDVSDTAQSAEGSTRKITLANVKTYMSASPSLVTPALGTPSSGTLTNCTGLPTAGLVDGSVTLAKMANLAQDQMIVRTTASTGVPETATVTAAARTVLDDTTVAAMVDTLGGASSTGTGGLVRATSPTLVTPALGVATATSINGTTIPTSTTLATANATATLSTGTTLNRGTHGNRLLICDTAATHSVDDDTGGSWGSGDSLYGVNTSTGVVVLQGDGTSTVTAGPFNTLSVPPGQEWTLFRTGTNAWRGGAADTGLQQNSQSAAYTTVWADRGKQILHPTADNNARTFTIDSNANVPYPVGTTLTFINQINTVTIAITTDTMTLAGAGTTGSRTLAANGIATAIKVSSTGWVINGTGLT